MLKNYLTITLRNINKHKGYSLINITGLAIGMACCILIFLYIRDELSFDRYHKNADQIYRLERKGIFNGMKYHNPESVHPIGPVLVDEFPEILQMVRFSPDICQVRDWRDVYSKERLFFTDKNVFEVFSFSLLKGDPSTALVEPYSVVLTEAMAQRYLDEAEPIGQTLTILWRGRKKADFQVTGILEEMPRNSHFRSQFLLSYSSLKTLLEPEEFQSWINFDMYTYLLLQKDLKPENLIQKFPAFLEKYMGQIGRQLFGPDIDIHTAMQLTLRPITDIYLSPKMEFEIADVSGDITRIYIFSVVALLVLLIACINFINLSTARSASRAKEIGLRKVMGAGKLSLIRQFLGESIILAVLALGLAIVLVELVLPLFNAFTAKELTLWSGEISLLPGLFFLAVFVGLAAGAYPAFFLSSFQPASVLRGVQRTATGGTSLLIRKGLVIFQFAISIMLIIGTFIMVKQMHYIKNKQLGFDKEHILVFTPEDPSFTPRAEMLKTELLQDPNILDVGTSSDVLGQQDYGSTLYRKEESSKEEFESLYGLEIDETFIPTLGISMVAGRNFSASFGTDETSGCIFNETAVAQFGWPSPEAALGKTLIEIAENPENERQSKIIGVVKDFHFTSLHRKIEPLLLSYGELNRHLLIRIRPHDISGTLASLERFFKKASPNYPFHYFFLDERFDVLYRKEQRMQQIFGYCSVLAILIACLGLFGLASFMTEQRTREIGIRKALGASVMSIMLLLSKEFTKWILLANVIAWPLAYVVMTRWLQNFAYRITIAPWIFFVSAIVAFLIALITVSGRTIKAALANPVDALRYE